MYFTGEPAVARELDRVFRIADDVFRHLIVRVEPEHVDMSRIEQPQPSAESAEAAGVGEAKEEPAAEEVAEAEAEAAAEEPVEAQVEESPETAPEEPAEEPEPPAAEQSEEIGDQEPKSEGE